MTHIMKKSKTGYTPRVTVFSSRKDTNNPTYLQDATVIATEISKAGYGINNGASLSGLMGVVAKTAHETGGHVYGIALSDYESVPHKYLEEYESYKFHTDRQHRLIELGDAYIALPGAIGTFHEILDVHLLNILGEMNKPLVLVGEYFNRYRDLIESFENEGLMHTDTTPLFYANDGAEAAAIVTKYFDSLIEEDYYPATFYPALTSDQIYKHISETVREYQILFEKIVMTVFPGVYPSNRFRSSRLFAKFVREYSKGKIVADLACGHGAMGLVALDAGATEVVMSDINPIAVQNAKCNLSNSENNGKGVVFESNLFEKIPSIYKNHFDVIFFNPPFQNEKLKKTDSSLAHAFKTLPDEESVLVKFLSTAKEYLAKDGVIYLGFSNKDLDSLHLLETTLTEKNYTFDIAEITNTETVADTRIYKITYTG